MGSGLFRMFKRLILFISLLGITAGLPLNWAAARAVTEARLNITITDVSDGDSLKAGSLRLRLHGIDAPEREQICTNADGKNYACGKRATEWLRQHVKTGDRLSCYLLDVDRYGRLIVRCFKSGKDINQAMVRAGWAVAYTRYSDEYLKAETEAKSEQNGLWQGPFIHPEVWRHENK